MSEHLSHLLPREPASRTSAAGVEVRFWCSPAEHQTWVTVHVAGTRTALVVPVLVGERARDIFDHPYAHAARRGVRTTTPAA